MEARRHERTQERQPSARIDWWASRPAPHAGLNNGMSIASKRLRALRNTNRRMPYSSASPPLAPLAAIQRAPTRWGPVSRRGAQDVGGNGRPCLALSRFSSRLASVREKLNSRLRDEWWMHRERLCARTRRRSHVHDGEALATAGPDSKTQHEEMPP